MTVRARGIGVSRGGAPVLEGVDVDARAGEVLVIVGPNGSGKSTLLHVLAGLLDADRGEVVREGRCALALQTPALLRRSVRSNIEEALRWWGVERPQRRVRAEAALSDFGVGHLSGRIANTLSGGQARRVHLARAVAVDADALLLDEPFAGLDPETRADLLFDVGTRLRSADRATVIVVQDLAEALALGDRMAVMLGGRIAASGPPRDLLAAPPTPAVARFFGYRGSVREGSAIRMVRPSDVILSESGRLEGRVCHFVAIEDGVRVEIETAGGSVAAATPLPGPPIGATVRFDLRGGVTFEASSTN